MEPKMIRLKLLSTAALMALALPLAMASDAFAQNQGGKGGYARGGGGGGMRGGGAATAGPRFSGGGGMSAGTRFSGGAGPGFSGRVATTNPSYHIRRELRCQLAGRQPKLARRKLARRQSMGRRWLRPSLSPRWRFLAGCSRRRRNWRQLRLLRQPGLLRFRLLRRRLLQRRLFL